MSWLRSYLIPEPSSEHIQLLVERFGRARWIDRSIITPDPIAIAWSPLGRERMGEVKVFVLRQEARAKAMQPQLHSQNPADETIHKRNESRTRRMQSKRLEDKAGCHYGEQRQTEPDR